MFSSVEIAAMAMERSLRGSTSTRSSGSDADSDTVTGGETFIDAEFVAKAADNRDRVMGKENSPFKVKKVKKHRRGKRGGSKQKNKLTAVPLAVNSQAKEMLAQLLPPPGSACNQVQTVDDRLALEDLSMGFSQKTSGANKKTIKSDKTTCLRPRSPKAPENSNEFLLADRESVNLTPRTLSMDGACGTVKCGDCHNVGLNPHNQVEACAVGSDPHDLSSQDAYVYEPLDSTDFFYQDFDRVYSSAIEESSIQDLMGTSTTQLQSKIMDMDKKAELLKEILQLRVSSPAKPSSLYSQPEVYNTGGLCNYSSDLQEIERLRRENAHLKEENLRFKD